MKIAVLLSVAALWLGNVFLGPAGRVGPTQAIADERATSRPVDIDGLDVTPGDRLVRGVTRPGRRADLAAPFDGIVAEVLVAEGDHVAAGTPIARMDDRVARALVASARLAAERRGPAAMAEAELRLARTRLERMLETGAAADAEIQESRIRVQQSEAGLMIAREELAQAGTTLALEQARLDRHVLRAPFDGHIARIIRRTGESSERRTPLAILVDPRTLDAVLDLPLDAWADLQVGAWYELLAGTPVGGVVVARLRTAEPYTDADVGTVRCVFELPNHDERMPSGFTVAVPRSGPRQVAEPVAATVSASPPATAPGRGT